MFRLFLTSAGDIRLKKIEAGTITTLVSGTWDTSAGIETDVRVTRDINGNFELFVNGASQRTATDSFVPSPVQIQL